MKTMTSAAIIGMGAMGVLYGSQIIKTLGRDAVCYPVNAARLRKFREQGIRCNGADCPFRVVDEARHTGPADLVIFAVKAAALGEAIETARCVVGGDSVILSLMNGITSEEILGEAFGPERVLYAVALGMDAAKNGPEVTWSRLGKTLLGIPPDQPEKAERLSAAADFFRRAGLPAEVSGDILKQLWGKFMLNVGVNQITMIYEAPNRVFQQPGEARDMMLQAMEEVLALARLEHVALGEEDLRQYLKLADSLPPDGVPSMRQDGAAHRKSEVELFSGTVVRLGKKHGCPTPVNAAIYQRVNEMERCY